MTKLKNCVQLLLLTVIVCKFEATPKKCEVKGKTLAVMELAKDSLLRAKRLIPECDDKENATIRNESDCGKKEKSSAYIDVALQLIEEAQKNYPTCDTNNVLEPEDDKTEKEKPDDKPLPSDCLEVMEQGNNHSGIYTIRISNTTASINKTVDVYCDMDTDGGGWTVIQRRDKFPVQEDFNRDWKSYKKGFGNLSREFWIGNEVIHALTHQGSNTLRFDFKDWNGIKAFAVYMYFRIENETDGYRLRLKGYEGNAGDSLRYSKDLRFSTFDRMHDSETRCAVEYNGGGWYFNCAYCNLNGLYIPDYWSNEHIFWDTFRARKGLAFQEIKIRSKYSANA